MKPIPTSKAISGITPPSTNLYASNMENLNAVFIEQGMPQHERLIKLNQIAIHQMSVLESDHNDRKLLK